jgi:uncharacterized SAM-binding protein YcdF (DUF218 family)
LWLACGAGVLAGLALGFMAFLATVSAPPEPPTPADAIVVLTGGARRIAAGLDLLEAGAAPVLLVSGAAPGLTRAALLRQEGREDAGLGGRVVIGRAAATTIGNAAEIAAFSGAARASRLLVVTSDYHMPRALLELRRALPSARFQPHPVAPPAGQSRRWGLLLAEYAKYVAAAAGVSILMPARDAGR